MMAQSRECSTSIAGTGASTKTIMDFQSRHPSIRTEQNESSHSEINTTDNGKGQYTQAV